MTKIVSLAGLLIAFCFLNQASAQKPIELTYSVFYPPAHKHTASAIEWAKDISERTNGRVKITVFPGGTLIPADKTYLGVINGIADIGWSVAGYTKGRFPFSEGLELPFGVKNAVTCSRLINEFYKNFPQMRKEFDEVKVMYLHGHGPGLVHTKKPVSKLEDLKGMKIRAPGSIGTIIALLGGAPVGMTMSEAYDALSKGVVEGILAPYEPLEGFKLAEVVKYTTESTCIGYTTIQYIIMNKEKWNSLPPDIQKIIEQINQEWIEKTADVWDGLDKSAKEYSLKQGHKVISLSKEEEEKWVKAVKPLLDSYVNNMKTKNLPGEEALKFCLDYLKKNQ
jgi:TRAP-type C4-dicarboxylate transport system substrate-binding protein